MFGANNRCVGVVLLSIVIIGLNGCLSNLPDPIDVDVEVVQSNVARDLSTQTSDADSNTLVRGNTAFATDLYRWLETQRTGNFFFSPYSISQALAMVYAGARGQTEQQMASALHFDLPQAQFHPTFNGLDLSLTSVPTLPDTDGEPFRLNVANAIWGQKDYAFLDNYLDVLARNYGAGMRLMDFLQDPEACRLTINHWVSDQTEQRISHLIPRGLITRDTLLVLTNAVYFQASWQFPFKLENTHAGLFFGLGGTLIVPMMTQVESFDYVEGDDFVAVELPYIGDRWAMLIVMPTAEQFALFESSLTVETVEQIVSQLVPTMLQLMMPKFNFDSDLLLKDALMALGMIDAFAGEADFSGIVEQGGLMIDEVIHKAYVSVDEAGTEAAAATAVVMIRSALPITLTLDHPFIFMIRDRLTGTVLFMGRVVDPSNS